MSTSFLPNVPDRPVDTGAAPRSGVVQNVLLVCGMVAALLWVGADIVAALRYEGYSYTAQAISELSAIGAPTRDFLIPLLNTYTVLELAFAVGVWMAAGTRRSLRMTAGLLGAHGILNLGVAITSYLTGPFAAMHTREELSQAGGTLANDTMHIVVIGITVLLILLMIGFAATAFGTRWRVYSYATLVAVFVFGLWASLDAPRIEANLPTPWMGLRERVNVYSFMLWMLLLGVMLLRTPAPRERVSRYDDA